MSINWNKPTFTGEVMPDWVDYNGHMRDAFYLLPMSYATDELMNRIGLDEQGREKLGHTLYTLEAHLVFLSEVKLGACIEIKSRIVESDHKRLSICHLMYSGKSHTLSAASEQLLVNVDSNSGRSCPFDRKIASLMTEASAPSIDEEWQHWLGRRITLATPSSG